MALELFKLLGTIAVENDQANNAIDETVKKAKDVRPTIDKITKAMEVAFAAVTAGVVALGTKAVKYNATIEQYTTSFEIMTGSAEKAAEVTERLKALGAATPFEMTELADATQLLVNYGFTADSAIESMMMLGDIAQGDADKLGRIATAYGQMSSAGKVSLEDVKQMIEAGFNPLQEITQTTGESMASLYDRISKGTISVDEITDAMKRSTAQGGKYFQSMQKQSQTLSGKWSTLKDTASQAIGEISKGISDWLSSKGIPAAIKAVEWLGENFEDLIPIVETVVAAAAGMYIAFKFPQMIEGIKNIGAAFASSAGIIGIASAAIAALTVVLVNAYRDANEASARFQEFSSRIDDVRTSSENTATAMKTLSDSFGETMLQSEMSAEKANAYLDVIDRIGEDGVLSADEQNDFNAAIAMLQTLYPDLQIEIDETTGLIKDGTGAIRDQIAAMQQQAQAAALQDIIKQAYEEQYAAMKNVNDAQQVYNDASSNNQAFYQRHAQLISDVNALLGTNFTTVSDCANAISGWTGATAVQTQKASELYQKLVPLVNIESENHAAVTDSMHALGEAQGAYDTASKHVEGYEAAIQDAAETGDYSASSISQSYDEVVNKSRETRDAVVSDAKDSAQGIRDADLGGVAADASADASAQVEANFKPDLYQSGVNAISGAESGMNAREGNLLQTARVLASKVTQAFNARLQIHSPSRVMAQSGRYIVEGVEQGIDDNADGAIQSMAKLAHGIQEAFDPQMNPIGGLIGNNGMESVDAFVSARNQSQPDQSAQSTDASADDIRELKELFRDFVETMPDVMTDAFSKMKFDVNNREFARLVKAVN